MAFFIKTKRFIPDEYQKSVYNVDYNKLYEMGYRLILTDLDNTLVSYDNDYADSRCIALINKLKKIGFKVVIVSNNIHKKRVKKIASMLEVPYVRFALKPFKRGLKKAIKSTGISKDKTIMMGDQLMTDVLGSKRLGIYVILIEAIKRKSEKWMTRFNRMLERRALCSVNKKYKKEYEALLAKYDRSNYGK